MNKESVTKQKLLDLPEIGEIVERVDNKEIEYKHEYDVKIKMKNGEVIEFPLTITTVHKSISLDEAKSILEKKAKELFTSNFDELILKGKLKTIVKTKKEITTIKVKKYLVGYYNQNLDGNYHDDKDEWKADNKEELFEFCEVIDEKLNETFISQYRRRRVTYLGEKINTQTIENEDEL